MSVKLGFRGPGHASRAAAVAAAAPASDIASLTIMGAAPLLDATGDYGDATSRIGVNGAGWVAKATMPYLAGQTFDPTRISLSLSDPGYDGAGSTTVSRTVTGRAVLRRQYNAASAKQISNDGLTFTVYFSLSDDVYQGSTITGATAAAGYYGGSAAGTIASTTNSSTVAYPKPLFGWLNLQHERWTGDALVEAVAYHRHAMNGRQVARVEFIATDASAHTAATQTASTVTLSTLLTQGNRPEVYSATIPLSALTQGDLCLVNARVFPWIGDSSAVLDLVADGVNTSGALATSQPDTPLRFVNDKAGAYGGGYAYVKAGAGGAPQVSRTAATARANPYATINAALTACQTFNNANSGHNDHSGSIIRLMDDGAGGAVAHVMSAGLSATAGSAMTVIEKDPLNTAAATLSLPNTRGTVDKIVWKVDIAQTSAAGLDGGNSNGNIMQAFESMTLATANSGIPINYRCGLTFCRNMNVSGGGNAPFFSDFTNVRVQAVLVAGCIDTASAGGAFVQGAVVVGNSWLQRVFATYGATYTLNDAHDGFIVSNNKFMDVRQATSPTPDRAIVKGLAFVQNVLERAVVGTSPALQIAGDDTTLAVDNIIEHHNTVVGERTNRMYTNQAASAGVIKRICSRFNIWHEYNCKTDTWTGASSVTGRVGNWRNRYTVSHLGNVCLTGQQGSGSPTNVSADPTNWLGEAWPAATYEVGSANVTFTNDQSLNGGNGGNGTYTLTHGGTDAAINQVPAGLAVLAFDLAGVARPNDGTGAAGAYQ